MINAIIIDSREPDWVKDLAFGGVPKSIATLEAGDFFIACQDAMLVIERKDANDLLSSIGDGRLFDQARRLAGLREDFGYYPYLMITGTLERGQKGNVVTDSRDTGWNWDAIQGALLSVQELGVYVLQIANDYDLENGIIRLANRERGKMVLQPQREAAVLSLPAQVLTAFPGIGKEKAQDILAVSDTLAIALMGLTDKRIEVLGVGESTQNNVRHVLGLRDNEVLEIITKEM